MPFDFASAPDPPDDYQCHLQWMHPEWHKIGNMLLTRFVREAWYECLGGWPLIESAPELLDEAGFRKFCYYCSTMNDELVAYEMPPTELAKLCPDLFPPESVTKLPATTSVDTEQKVASSAGNDDAEKKMPGTRKSNKKKRARENAAAEMSKAIKIDEQKAPPLTLLDLDDNIKSRIASYLDPVIWWHLQQTCRSNRLWPKPPPEVDYQAIYFWFSDDHFCAWQGVARTMRGVEDAIKYLYAQDREKTKEEWKEYSVNVKFLTFDITKGTILPLLTYEKTQSKEDPCPARLHEQASKVLGVGLSPIAAGSGEWETYKIWPNGEHPEQIAPGYTFGTMLKWLNDYESSDLVDLDYIDCKPTSCPDCGETDKDCQCPRDFDYIRSLDIDKRGWRESSDIWYNPKWFSKQKMVTKRATLPKSQTTDWKIFSDTVYIYHPRYG